MNPIVSFIVAIYNVEPYLRECLESLHKQKAKNIEFLLIDDGSTDASGDICDEFALKDDRFHVCHQKNMGVSEARNNGIRLAKGEWLCFVDGDDLVDINLMDNLHFDKFSHCELVFFGYNNLLPGGKYEKKSMPDLAVQELDQSEIIALSHGVLNGDTDKCKKYQNSCFGYHEPWAKLYKKEFLEKWNLTYRKGIKRGQDSVFNFEVYQCATKAYFEPIIGYYYRKNELSISNKYNSKITENYNSMINAFWQIMQKNGCEQEYIGDAYLMGIRSFLYCCKIDFCHKDNKKNFITKRKEFIQTRNQEIYRMCFKNANYSEFRADVRFSALLCKYKCYALFGISWRAYEWLKSKK